ncbi:MAG: methionyl-tRNA formyltransferase [Candidatus Omnitrophota bacterium]|nr:methionyl-tRNA formyltransferase [Candidatus Omnitrophota bacterium]
MNLVFFGSSDFSMAAFKACMDSPHEILLVVTTPDQKKGRGLKLMPTVVREAAQAEGLDVIAPEKLSSPDVLDQVRALAPDLFVVSSYGKYIPTAYLTIPKIASLNVHPSLLPKYRGCAPIQYSILNGDSETGVTILEVATELDGGDMFHQIRVPLGRETDCVKLTEDLAKLSYRALMETFEKAAAGKLLRSKQDETLSSYTPKLKKADGLIRWSDPAFRIANQVRALLPWPTAYFEIGDKLIQVLKGTSDEMGCAEAEPGSIIAINKDGEVRVQTGKGSFIAQCVKPPGKKEMKAADFANGMRLKPGFRLRAG